MRPVILGGAVALASAAAVSAAGLGAGPSGGDTTVVTREIWTRVSDRCG